MIRHTWMEDVDRAANYCIACGQFGHYPIEHEMEPTEAQLQAISAVLQIETTVEPEPESRLGKDILIATLGLLVGVLLKAWLG